MYKNPVLPGFYPDPSVCRVREDYYLATSSFSYFPGVPVFHSRDLVNWEQLGHALTRPSQLNLDGAGQSKGIYAPTIRYNDGLFYIITTNVSYGGNFIVTAENPAGPWSEPYWLPDAPGIDPSLFFDDDGRAYYTGTRPAPEGPKYYGNWEIWLQELNLKTMSLTGEKHALWRGALRDAVWPEGPHLYKINGLYYLMIAEAGTEHRHAITIARSESLKGPYAGNPSNPVLTNRHLGKDFPVVNVGHGDLVQTQNGEWWMVMLASRPYGGYYRNLGRETFLAPVAWEDGWPVASPGTGRLELGYAAPSLEECRFAAEAACDNFEDSELSHCWNFLRTPRESFYSLSDRPGYLRLKLRPQKLSEPANPSFVGRRQRHIDFSACTAMEFTPSKPGESAGLVLLQSDTYHFRYKYLIDDGQKVLRLMECRDGAEKKLTRIVVDAERLYLKVEAHGQNYSFYYGTSPSKLQVIAQNIDGRILSTDLAGGFVGAYIGMYASGNGSDSENKADFDWFEYQGL